MHSVPVKAYFPYVIAPAVVTQVLKDNYYSKFYPVSIPTFHEIYNSWLNIVPYFDT